MTGEFSWSILFPFHALTLHRSQFPHSCLLQNFLQCSTSYPLVLSPYSANSYFFPVSPIIPSLSSSFLLLQHIFIPFPHILLLILSTCLHPITSVPFQTSASRSPEIRSVSRDSALLSSPCSSAMFPLIPVSFRKYTQMPHIPSLLHNPLTPQSS